MERSHKRILITALGYGASWEGHAESTPWSVYLTPNGCPVSEGGEYPGESSDSRLVLSDLRMEQATLLADRLVLIMTDLGHMCVTEVIGDA